MNSLEAFLSSFADAKEKCSKTLLLYPDVPCHKTPPSCTFFSAEHPWAVGQISITSDRMERKYPSAAETIDSTSSLPIKSLDSVCAGVPYCKVARNSRKKQSIGASFLICCSDFVMSPSRTLDGASFAKSSIFITDQATCSSAQCAIL